MSLVSRILAIVIASLVGAVYGVVGTVAHASRFGVVPVGLVLALVAVVAVILAMRLLAGRTSALAGAIGLLASIVIFSGEGPGGSVIAPQDDPLALVWAVAAPLLAAMVVGWPSTFRMAPAGAGAGSSAD